jgi:hypothetical protein
MDSDFRRNDGGEAMKRREVPELVRAVYGFDAVLVMSGSIPSSNL